MSVVFLHSRLRREIFIDRSDFMDEHEAAAMPGGFKRLTPGQAVRLRGAYVIRCSEVVRDPATGEVLRLHCEHDDLTLGKKPVGYKAAGVIHWVSAEHGIPVTLRRFGNLFRTTSAHETVQEEQEQEAEVCKQTEGAVVAEASESEATDAALLLQNLNPASSVEFAGVVEPSVLEAVRAGSSSDSELVRRCWFQFEREGYYVLDERLDADGQLCRNGGQDRGLVFNMVVGLRQKKPSGSGSGDGNRKAKRQNTSAGKRGNGGNNHQPAIEL